MSPFAAVVLAGGTAVRLGGFDKAGIEVDGRTLLTRVLDSLADAAEVVVVGDPVPTERPVTFTREDPAYGGPVAGLLTGRDALLRTPELLVVVAVDMPWLSAGTVARLLAAAADHDGSALVDPDGRRQLAMALRTERLDAVRPDFEAQHGYPVRRLLLPLDLADVHTDGREHRDIDTWADLRDAAD